jgi:aspartyl protease family protein
MSMSAGARQAVGLAAVWLLAAGCTAVSIVYFSEIKMLTAGLLGSPRLGPVAREDRSAGRSEAARPVGRIVELKADARGHYTTEAEINGRSIATLVDTGASIVALTFEDARRVGLYIRDADYTHRVNTANGLARVAPVVLDRVSIGNITVRNVPAAVTEPGKLSTSLLGMSFLGRLQRVDMRSGMLLLEE